MIHNRAADDELLDVLASFDGDVVLHCFSYPAALRTVLERGYYVSFAGNVTYKNASELRVAATQVPARPAARRDRLAVPRAASRVRGRPNEPRNLVHTLDALARARGAERDELEAQIDANAARVFGLP